MAASLFGTGTALNANVNGTLVPQSFVGTAGQTLFVITNFSYTPGTNSLLVFVNGDKQISGKDFSETSSTSFTLLEGVLLGDYVEVIGFPQVDLSAVTSGSVFHTDSSIGGTSRALVNILNDIPQVKNFGAVGDGVNSDQTAIQNAVTSCFASGDPLYWGAGTYLSTGNIANFQDVTHYGPGIVKRGTDLFYITPKKGQTNNLYVAPGGSNSNDGLTAVVPFLTVQKSVSVLNEWAGYLLGRWRVNLAAGTYNENVQYDSLHGSEYPVNFLGPVAGHPTVPTAIINATDPNTAVFIASMDGWLQFTDIKFTGATLDAGMSFAGPNLRVSLTNIHISGCLEGIVGTNMVVMTGSGGIWTGTGKAVSGGFGYRGLFNCTHSITGTSLPTGTQISQYETGVLLDEGDQGHIDYMTISDCTNGINQKRGAGACNTKGALIQRCTVGILAENNGWFNNTLAFGTGGNANSTNVITAGSSPEFTERTQTVQSKTERLNHTLVTTTLTGSTTKTSLWTLHTIPDWALGEFSTPDPAHIARIVLYLQPTLAGTCTLFLTMGGTDIGSIVVPAGTTDARLEIVTNFQSASAQRTAMAMVRNAGNTLSYSTSTVATKNISNVLEIKGQLSSGADTMILRHGEYHTTIGG